MESVMLLYSGRILEHGRNPQNSGRLVDANREAKADNPMCGDHIIVSIKLEGSRVVRLSFEAEACAVCRASASMMTTAVAGVSESQAGHLARAFVAMLSAGEAEKAGVDLGDLGVFAAVRHLPSRRDCAALPWVALMTALSGN